MKHFVVLYLSAFYLCWCHQALSRQYTHLCCQRAQTAFWRPHRFAAFPACPQITSCPLRGQGCVEEREENVMNSILYSQCWRHGWYRVKTVFFLFLKTVFLWQLHLCPPGCSIDHRDHKPGKWHEKSVIWMCMYVCMFIKSNLPGTPLTTFHLYLIQLDTYPSIWQTRTSVHREDLLASLHNVKGLLQAWFYSSG